MAQDLDSFKPFLKDYLESVTQPRKNGMYVCPICGSGTGKNHTAAFKLYENSNRWTCFGSCGGRSGDIFDLYAAVNKCDLSEATKSIIAMYGSPTTARSSAREDFRPMEPRNTKPGEATQQQPAQPRSYADEIARYADALPGSAGQAYLEGRGLTLETMKRFKLGYNSQKQVVTIPYNQQCSYYGQRSVNPNSSRPHDNLQGVSMPLFNAAALYASDACFVVESPLCAISIVQEGGAAVAISGTSGKNRLCEQLKRKPTAAALILCLDNDDAGRKATEDIGNALDAIGGIFFVNGTAAIMGTETDSTAADFRKDPNDVLQRSGAEALRTAIVETVEGTLYERAAAAQEADAERQQRTGAGMVDAFLEAIQTHKYEPMPTGIRDIDRALYGGFTRQQVVMLGAAPGAGKTALAQWIFEGMAQRGTPCVYVNLEMSREQLLARSISRIAARRGRKVTTLEVMQGYKWTDEQRAAILAAAQEYKDNIAPRFIMNPDGINADLDTILAYIEKEAQRAEAAGEAAPVCVLDYLQLVSGQPREDVATVIKRAVAGLKAYAINHNSLVLIIIAHNRKSNASGDVGMESGRDTSAIEYSADLQLALTFTGCLNRDGKKGKAPEDLTPEEQKQITLRIVKGRFGGRGTDVDLIFDGETMTYTQTADEFIEYKGQTPFDDPGRCKPKQMRF
ncbi:DnaB-like helicase C-terminal domain-containing protein [Butyricicoccus sp.]|uniref:DnaB-like helicase C-terminal domain-containing protein n=1 Tax=Butyricicoccus sp. TaxID=2049021 RepID=UPI003F186610